MKLLAAKANTTFSFIIFGRSKREKAGVQARLPVARMPPDVRTGQTE
jgi:hypothetical protein